MALDANMEQMAQKMAAGRVAAGRGPQMPVPEEVAPAEPSGLAEVRSLLQQAMELLDNMGGGEVV
ncbi:MAG: hypothetical protein ABIJ57_09515 [Pseudomonadota bacterium]|uniref:Uncharacterized protein n=1 Tax=viral metagenome TaxID=1070528 RepID=A0A6M3J8T6_9ZZZZ